MEEVDKKTENSNEEKQDYLSDLIKYLYSDIADRSEYTSDDKKEVTSEKIIERQKELEFRQEQLKNDDFEQNIKLKKKTLDILFIFLVGETVVIFFFTFLQATKKCGFELEEWSFKLLIGATITQITAMLTIAIKHLFPKNRF